MKLPPANLQYDSGKGAKAIALSDIDKKFYQTATIKKSTLNMSNFSETRTF